MRAGPMRPEAACRPQAMSLLPCLPLRLMLWLAALPTLGLGSTLAGVVHYPSFNSKGVMVPPEKNLIEPLSRVGEVNDTASKEQSQFVYIGCYSALLSQITRDSEQESSYDPNACVAYCRSVYPTTPLKRLVAAVHGKRCGCADSMEPFVEDETGTECVYECKFFQNPLCGGGSTHWGVFKQYDYQSMASNGAYDPWRYIWYTVVVLKETTVGCSNQFRCTQDINFGGGQITLDVDSLKPYERYYLHATNAQTGEAAFQYQVRLPGILHGVQYDLDSSRLVGLLTSDTIGRIPTQRGPVNKWEYLLFTIDINASIETRPYLTWPEEPPVMYDITTFQKSSESVMAFTSLSAIMSLNRQDMYMFCQINLPTPSSPDVSVWNLKSAKSKIYFVSIPDGEVIESRDLDFVVYQLFSNEKFGDITAVGRRSAVMQYVTLAQVYYSATEDRKKVKWLYNPGRPEDNYLSAKSDFENIWVHPGLGVSEHLYNKSYLFYRKYPNDYTIDRIPEQTGMLLMEASIRGFGVTDWCNPDDGCHSTISWQVPYAGIFNKEPRIPLSLAAPALVSARFALSGSTINVVFDRNTLRGATPVDTDNDIVPNFIDYGTQLVGEWDCGLVFDKATTEILGEFPDIYCNWYSDLAININLQDEKTLVEVGDQLFLLKDKIYTIPRPADNEYSMAAMGGISVSLPSPLEDPVINMNGIFEVDECNDVTMASEPYNVGGRPTFTWELIGITDMTNNPAGRIYNQTKIEQITAVLENATVDNRPSVIISSSYLEAATAYEITISVQSRWGPVTNMTKVITKLDYPAPMVSIWGGNEAQIKYRTQQVDILAEGQPSTCANVDRKLGYTWTETSGKLNPELNSAQWGIITGSKSLIIPPFTLDTAPISEGPDAVEVYNFSVAAYAVASPTKAAYEFATVIIKRSPIYVKFTVEDRLVTRGDVIVIDARASQDPDYPTLAGGTFKGTFRWYCLTPDRFPCFVGALEDGEFVIDQDDEVCVTDIQTRMPYGGRTYSTPLWEDKRSYCRWARGVMMIQSTNFTAGEYLFTTLITSLDGRTALKDIRIEITEMRVPSVSLEIAYDGEPPARWPTTRVMSFEGTLEEDADATIDYQIGWSIWEYMRNPEYDMDAARRAADAGEEYRVDIEAWQDQSDIYDISNRTRFFWSTSLWTFKIYENVLAPAVQYKLKMSVDIGNGVVGYADKTFDTAGLAPRSGTLSCTPLNSTMELMRTLNAENWVADDIPLNYKFGYLAQLSAQEVIKVSFHTEKLPMGEFVVEQLIMGERTTNYSVVVYVEVSTPYGATTTKQLVAQSTPPENRTAYIEEQFAALASADPEVVVSILANILAVAESPDVASGQTASPETVVLLEKVLDAVNNAIEEAPMTQSQAAGTVNVINQIIHAGKKDTASMDTVESFTLKAVENGLINVNDPDVIKGAFEAISSMLPTENSLDDTSSIEVPEGLSFGAFGQSTRSSRSKMYQFKATSQSVRTGSEDYSVAMDSAMGRQDSNHKLPNGDEGIIDKCLSAYCDVPLLFCIMPMDQVSDRTTRNRDLIYTCCEAPNPVSLCESAPCWFRGLKCPTFEDNEELLGEGPDSDSTLAPGSSLARRLAPSPHLQQKRWSEDHGYGGLFKRKAASPSKLPRIPPIELRRANARLLEELSPGVEYNDSAEPGWTIEEIEKWEVYALRDVQKALESKAIAEENAMKERMAIVLKLEKFLIRN